MGESIDNHSADRLPESSFVESQLEATTGIWRALRESSQVAECTIHLLLFSLDESTRTLLTLCHTGRLRDAFVISRVVYESALNACFILASGSGVAERAWRHAHQRSIRDLDRTIKIANQEFRVKWSEADSVLSDSANRALLDEFTTAKGREIPSWTPESVRQRLGAVINTFGFGRAKGLFFGILLYRHASEIAHATVFGALYALGAMDPRGRPRSVAELDAFRLEELRLILMLVGYTLYALVQVLGTQFSVEHSVNESVKSFHEYNRHHSTTSGDSG